MMSSLNADESPTPLSVLSSITDAALRFFCILSFQIMVVKSVHTSLLFLFFSFSYMF